jgi:predicted transcriptional regulator
MPRRPRLARPRPSPPAAAGPATLLAAALLAPYVPQRLLETRARRVLCEQVRRYPGLHLAELARSVGMQANHAKYHLRRLERCGLVSSRRSRGFITYFPTVEREVGLLDGIAPRDKAALALLRRPVPLRIARFLIDHLEANHAQLLRETGVARATLHYHVQRMEEAEVIESQKRGRERWYWIPDPDHVASLLHEHNVVARVVTHDEAGLVEGQTVVN